jgi:hypothetical protein
MIDMFLPNMFFMESGNIGAVNDGANESIDDGVKTFRKRIKFKKAEIACWIAFAALAAITFLLVGLTLGGKGTALMLSKGLIRSLNIAMGSQIAALVGVVSVVFCIIAFIARSKATKLALKGDTFEIPKKQETDSSEPLADAERIIQYGDTSEVKPELGNTENPEEQRAVPTVEAN